MLLWFVVPALAFGDNDADGFQSPLDCNDADASIHPGAFESPDDGKDSDCTGGDLCYTDADNDGSRLTSTIASNDVDCTDAFEGRTADTIDCNDGNAAVHPGAAEVFANGVDEDCNGQELCYGDADNDGSRTTGSVVSTDLDCLDASEGGPNDPIDCNDANAAIHPGAGEIVADNIDQDCNGGEVCYADADNDGSRLSTTTVTSADADCFDAFEGASTDTIDCNDALSSVHPGAPEVFANGVDEDCNGQELCYGDADNDGSRTTGSVVSTDLDCLDAAEGGPNDPIDCNDANAAVHPGAAEVVGDGIDEDCGGTEICFADADNDGARTASTVTSADPDCGDASEGLATDPIDCNDANGTVYPGALEIAGDGVDEDCTGTELCFTDGDNDGSRLGSTVTSADADCTDANEGVSGDPIDCNDGSATIHPGAAEVVADGVDQSCDGQEACYADADNDGSRTSGTVTSADLDCTDASEGVGADPLDCNDGNAAVHPGATEVVGDGVDQDCNAQESCYADADNDGARTSATVTSADADCADGFEAVSGDPLDCNDANAAILPGATEIAGDGVDQDCTSTELCFTDGDNDGSRTASTTLSTDTDCADANEGVTGDPVDCNDANATVHPGATESVADGLDQDCNGQELCFADADNDGSRTSGTVTSTDVDCADASEAVAGDPLDCNDASAAVHPGAAEVVADGVDQDCDGDETCFVDADSDGARTSATLLSADLDCADAGEAVTADPLDCNDAAASVHPGATEVVADGIDQSCDGQETCYADADNDGSRTSATVVSSDTDCSDASEGLASDSVDCNDAVAAIHPGAPELTGDNVDQDCTGTEDCFTDADDDGSRTAGVTGSADADCADAFEAVTADPLDCDDAVAAVHPGATEIVGDEVDEDCDGGESCFVDADGDGGRSAGVVASADLDCADGAEVPASAALDCDDADAAIHAGAAEVVGDAVDQDCDGGEVCFADADLDGAHGVDPVGSADVDCVDAGEGGLADPEDCDDADDASFPGATEIVGDQVDEDCDGGEVCYADLDLDGTRDEAIVASDDGDCLDATEALVDAPLDCDDVNPDVSPLHPELCDGVDNDCDGVLDVPDCDPNDVDSDGLTNVDEEALCTAAGLDAGVCPVDPDVDDDAVIDGVEVPDPAAAQDSDGDGAPDFHDPDDDDDAITSRRENGIQCGGELVAVYDVAGGYWTFSCYEVPFDFGGNELTAYPDTDGDGAPDFLDIDDDGDGVDTRDEGEGDVDCDEIENWLDPDDADGPCADEPEPTGPDTTPTSPTSTPTATEPDPTDADPADGADEPDPKAPDAGCACGSAGPGGSVGAMALIALALGRRKVRILAH